MKKNIPLRMCIACREMKPKAELIKVVKNKEGDFKIDKTGKLDGRGAYLCNLEVCKTKTIKNKLINRAFSSNVPKEIYNELEESKS